MRQRLRAIIRKEFIQALRDPRIRSMLLILPLMQLLIFGYAVNLDVDTANIAWMGQDNTPQTRELRAQFEGSVHFINAGLARDEPQTQSMLDHGQVDGVILGPPAFPRDVTRA